MGVINPVSNDDELDYRILRGIFETENSNLETLSIEVNKEFNSLQIQMFDGEVLREEFNLSDNIVPICLLPIGYKDESCPESPNHNKRKDLTDLVEYV